jgi:hypothetical protein
VKFWQIRLIVSDSFVFCKFRAQFMISMNGLLVSGFGAIRKVLGCKLEGLGGAIRRSSDRIQVQFCRNLRVSVRFLIPSYKTA